MKKSSRIALSLFTAIFLCFPITVQAVEVPAFTTCPAPGGTIIASYSDGTHGVPGDVTTYTGSDIVYQLNQSQVVQCLCPPNTLGVQTWWWKSGALSKSDRALLESQGWVYVPNGSLWGLEDAEYYAKNIAYSCTSNGGTGGGGTGGGSSSSGSSDTSSESGVGGVTTGQVLGAFAATGSWEFIALYAAGASLLLILSWILTRLTR